MLKLVYFVVVSDIYILSSSVTIADFFAYEVLENYIALSSQSFESLPHCIALHDAVHALPALVQYRKAGGAGCVDFNNKSALFRH
jgi:hypothetical protein